MSDTLTFTQVDAAFRAVLGYPARKCDHAVIDLLGGTVEVTADYIWDHFLGEPDEPNADTIRCEIERALRGAK